MISRNSRSNFPIVRFSGRVLITCLFLLVVVLSAAGVILADTTDVSAPVAAAQPDGFPLLWIVIGVGAILVVLVVVFALRRGGKIETGASWVINSGEKAGHVCPITKTKLKIGADQDNDVVLTDEHIARHHAVLAYQQGTFTCADLNTLHGTYINGKRIEEQTIQAGDKINLGKSVDCEIRME